MSGFHNLIQVVFHIQWRVNNRIHIYHAFCGFSFVRVCLKVLWYLWKYFRVTFCCFVLCQWISPCKTACTTTFWLFWYIRVCVCGTVATALQLYLFNWFYYLQFYVLHCLRLLLNCLSFVDFFVQISLILFLIVSSSCNRIMRIRAEVWKESPRTWIEGMNGDLTIWILDLMIGTWFLMVGFCFYLSSIQYRRIWLSIIGYYVVKMLPTTLISF